MAITPPTTAQHKTDQNNGTVEKDRKQFRDAIAEYYQADHAAAMQILEEKKPGWEKAFIDHRKATMDRVALTMPDLLKKHRNLLSGDDLKPRDRNTVRVGDFKWIVLNEDKDLQFFTVAMVFDPGQMTPPHTHKTLCFGMPYQGKVQEFIFDPTTKKVINSPKPNSQNIEIVSLGATGDCHAVSNYLKRRKASEPKPRHMAVAINLYDGYDLHAMQKGEIVPMVTGQNTDSLGAANRSFKIPGFPCPETGVKIPRSR